MNERQRKIRFGLILQGCIEEALVNTRYSTFKQNPKYNEDLMTPDFLIPDEISPKYFIEVTQSEARDSFRMKILRYFEAVCEAKAYFGPKIISVNILMGNPHFEIPAGNLRALYSFFDVNINPRSDISDVNLQSLINKLEADALSLAENESFTDVKSAVGIIKTKHVIALLELGKLIEEALDNAKLKQNLFPLWKTEKERILKVRNVDGQLSAAASYKLPLVQSLLLEDSDFLELTASKDINKTSAKLKQALVSARLVETIDTIQGKKYFLVSSLKEFIKYPESIKLRDDCKSYLDTDPSMRYFFEDIRNGQRRLDMSLAFVELLHRDRKTFSKGIRTCFDTGTYAGIEHQRCWLADLMPLAVNESHNSFTRRMYQHPSYDLKLGNPFANIVIRSPRLGNDPTVIAKYISVAVDCFYQACKEQRINVAAVDHLALANKLQAFRLAAAIKLHKLNPLYLLVESACKREGYSFIYGSCDNILSDLTAEVGALAKFHLYKIETPQGLILVNALYVDEYGGLDKAKEWAARGRTFLYKITGSEIRHSDVKGMIFIADGQWKPEAIKRLRIAGWDVCRPAEFHRKLKAYVEIRL
jgi:hypothetical protein